MKEEELRKEMGRRLRILRLFHALDQREFADRIETKQAFVSEWEQGKKFISTKYLLRISHEFGLSISHFSPYDDPIIDIGYSKNRQNHGK